MTLESSYIEKYADELTSVASKEDGIRRLYKYVTWPNGELIKNNKGIFSALCEFVVFNECIKHTFYRIAYLRYENKIGELYANISKQQNKETASLTYKEAFMLFQIIGKKQVRKILDFENVSTYTYNYIIKSLDEHDYNIFEKALGESDYSMLMKNLWIIRFVLLGIRKQPEFAFTYEDLLDKSPWIDGDDLSKFFNLLSNEEQFIEDRVNEFVQRCITGDESIEVGIETHYYDLLAARVVQRIDKNKLSYEQLSDTEKKNFTNKVHEISTISDGTFYPKWLNWLTQNFKNSNDLDRFISSYNSVGEKFEIDITKLNIICGLLSCQRKDIANFFKVEVAKVFGTDHDYNWENCEEDIVSLRDYIIYHTTLMLEVYDYVKDTLSKEDRIVLEWLFGCSKYTEIVKPLLKKTYSNKQQSVEEPSIVDTEISEIDINSSYPTTLRFDGRLHNKTLQDLVCKKYLPQWFDNKTNDPLYIKYVFFGSGIEPKEKIVFTGSKTELTIFVLFLSKGYGKSEIWSYFNQYIVDKNRKPVFAKNARSNVKENLWDAEDRLRQALMKMVDNNKQPELSKEIFEDLK